MDKVQDFLDKVPVLQETPDYDIVVWEPGTQMHMRIYFTGGGKPCDEHPDGYVSMNAEFVDRIGDNCIFDAFSAIMAEEGHSDEEISGLKYRFLKKINDLRYPEPADKN